MSINTNYSMFSASSQQRKATSEAFQLMAISLEAYDSIASTYDSSGTFEG